TPAWPIAIGPLHSRLRRTFVIGRQFERMVVTPLTSAGTTRLRTWRMLHSGCTPVSIFRRRRGGSLMQRLGLGVLLGTRHGMGGYLVLDRAGKVHRAAGVVFHEAPKGSPDSSLEPVEPKEPVNTEDGEVRYFQMPGPLPAVGATARTEQLSI